MLIILLAVTDQRGGSMCIFVRNGLQYVIIPKPQEFAELQIVCAKFIFSYYTKTARVC